MLPVGEAAHAALSVLVAAHPFRQIVIGADRTGSVHMQLTDSQLCALAERKRGWPWNGYELRLIRAAGKYPPQRLNIPRTEIKATESNTIGSGSV